MEPGARQGRSAPDRVRRRGRRPPVEPRSGDLRRGSMAEARVANWLRRGEATLAAGLVAIALVGSLGSRRPSREAGGTVRRLREPARRRRRRYADSCREVATATTIDGRLARVRGRSAARTGCRQLRRSLFRAPHHRGHPSTAQFPCQTLAELGLVGMAFLLLVVGAVFAGLAGARRLHRERARAPHSCGGRRRDLRGVARPHERRLLHNIPGVTGVALCARPLWWHLCGTWRAVVDFEAESSPSPSSEWRQWQPRIPSAGSPTRTRTASTPATPYELIPSSRSGLANRSRSMASPSRPHVSSRHEARQIPRGAGHASRRGGARAAGQSPMGPTRRPHGQARQVHAARRYYQRSLELNPRNPFVKPLAQDPRNALAEVAD